MTRLESRLKVIEVEARWLVMTVMMEVWWDLEMLIVMVDLEAQHVWVIHGGPLGEVAVVCGNMGRGRHRLKGGAVVVGARRIARQGWFPTSAMVAGLGDVEVVAQVEERKLRFGGRLGRWLRHGGAVDVGCGLVGWSRDLELVICGRGEMGFGEAWWYRFVAQWLFGAQRRRGKSFATVVWVVEYAVCGNDFVDLCSWVFLGFMLLVLPFRIYVSAYDVGRSPLEMRLCLAEEPIVLWRFHYSPVLFTEFGTTGCILLLQTCLDHYGYARRDTKDMQHEPILEAVIKYLLEKPNFSTVFSESMKNMEINESFLGIFCNVLQLSLLEKIIISLALSDSENPDFRLCVFTYFCNIEELCANPGSLSFHDQIHNIIMFLKQSEGLSKHVDSFMQILSLVQFKDTPPFVLTPLLPDEMHEADFLRNMELFHDCGENDFDAILADIQKEMDMGDIVKELGYGCTVDVSQCKEIFSLFLPLTEQTLSKLLGAIACTHTGLEDNQNTYLSFRAAHGYNVSELPPLNSWNIDVLIDTVKHLAPHTNWVQVIENLDHEGFFLPSEEAFSFLMSVYKHFCKEPFPLHAICGSVWKNTEGQLSFLKYAVSAPPEMFTFAHSGRQLAYADAINGHKLQNGHANHAWLCLDLLDVLCQLAEKGHASIVQSVLDYPLKHCPEILLLGMAHINTAYNLLQQEVSLIVFPMIVKSSVGSGMILHLWHVNPNLVFRGIIDSQNNDADSIIRIVDICQELKILSSVVEIIPSYYSIRLAAVASRKEFLDLEKWLSSNLITYKETFFEECLKFVKDAHFGGSQNLSGKSFHPSGAVLSLYADTTATVLKVLKSHNDLVATRQLSEEMERLHISIIDSNSRLQNSGTVDSSTSDGYADDIEAEANSYFHQMFSDQLTINAMVQMLARFKESSVKREKSIFECMIANLFEEYRFFPKYPERQLKIAAVLFGSVIKHQLVTHLSLGIALRYVLDALRKPADSKMFLFGSLALEQFVDRLIEWPQYCNHILQISHLRNTHSEIVAFIEQALARISSGHADVDGASHTSVISNHHSAQATLGHVEAVQLRMDSQL
ncbi:unnamed protein product [Sphenostylis stenocarpa]|uniref:CCR4-NOT transcription complex subunit 1 n=1 Tax=Sphenostylis stenocarpa TaxID=92480 RepID=A0AA86VIF7_9FABA|nr:unnamed protein product [Sphenostylis stenocarpa]